MTPSLPPPVLDFLRLGDPRVSVSVGLVVLALLLAGLTAKVMLQAGAAFPRRDLLRLLTIVVLPLLVVFLATVLERFRDLA
jgi:K+-transporting ATPase A subunit